MTRISSTSLVVLALVAAPGCSGSGASGDGAPGDLVAEASTDLPGADSLPPKACTKVKDLDSQGGATGTIGAVDQNDTHLPRQGCTGKQTPGADHLYRASLQGGKRYQITLTASLVYNVALYVLSDCASAAATCRAGADWQGAGGGEFVLFTPPVTGTYYIGVDSPYASGAPFSSGSYTLSVKAVAEAGNEVCGQASNVAFSGNLATATGDSSLAKSDTALKSAGCTGAATPGPDLFYQVSLVNGKYYRFTLTPSAGFDAALYLLESCAAPCKDGQGADRASAGGAEVIDYLATADFPMYVGVDSRHPVGHPLAGGPFTLTVEDLLTPEGNACSSSAQLTVGKISKGSTAKATNAITLGGGQSCGWLKTPGPDQFFGVNLEKGETYRIRVTPNKSFDPAVYVFTDCVLAASTCLAGADTAPAGFPEQVIITAPKKLAYRIAVDSWSPTETGSFSIEVTKLPSSPSNSACDAPTALTYASTGLTVKGNTAGAADEFAVDCATPSGSLTGGPWTGPQLYYALTLPGPTKKYQVRVLADDFDAALYAFPAATSCGAASINHVCVGKSSDVPLGGANEEISLGPGKWIIAVDSHSPHSAGSFTLQVTEEALPTFTAPFKLDFESSCGKLLARGDWECGKIAFKGGVGCASPASPPTSGTVMWGTKLNTCHGPLNNSSSTSTTCKNSYTGDDSTLSFKVNVPPSVKNPTLRFKYWSDFATPGDWAEIRINKTISAHAFCSSQHLGATGWKTRSVKLPASLIAAVHEISFHFVATAGTNHAGLYIDDVEVLHVP